MIKKLIQRIASRFGYEIRHVPHVVSRAGNAQIRLSLDHIIARAMIDTKEFHFIQVGAFDGITGDPIGQLARKFNWSGVLVEPQKDAFAMLQDTYRGRTNVHFENAVVSKTSGFVDFYKDRKSGSLLASLDRELFVKNRGGNPDDIEVLSVASITLNEIVEKYDLSVIDLLQIDTEGHDFEVIKSLSFSRIMPRIINYEHSHLSISDRVCCWEYLIGYGYKLYVQQPDTIAVNDGCRKRS